MPFLQIGYKQIHYADLKPEQAIRETLIFMHGLGSSQNYYHAVTQGLLVHGFRCIIFDNTGAGRSAYTYVEQSIESLGEDIIAVLDALAVTKAVVVGHSMGGSVHSHWRKAEQELTACSIVAAHLAAERSDRIVAAILIGPVYPNPDMVPIFQKRIETVEKEGMQPMADTIPSAAVVCGHPARGGVYWSLQEYLEGRFLPGTSLNDLTNPPTHLKRKLLMKDLGQERFSFSPGIHSRTALRTRPCWVCV